jgi:hypothetical protein
MNERPAIYRRHSRRSVLGFSAAALLVTMTVGSAMAIERADQVGKPLRDNLRATISSASRQSGGTVAINLALRWTGPNRSWVFDPVTPVTVFFWSGLKARRAGASFVLQKIHLDPSFANGPPGAASATIVAAIPASAKWLSVALGTSGLETAPQAIP